MFDLGGRYHPKDNESKLSTAYSQHHVGGISRSNLSQHHEQLSAVIEGKVGDSLVEHLLLEYYQSLEATQSQNLLDEGVTQWNLPQHMTVSILIHNNVLSLDFSFKYVKQL